MTDNPGDTSTGKVAPSAKREDVLIRQIESKIALEGENTSAAAAVEFSKLVSLATPMEKLQLWIGWLSALISGAALPVFFFYIGPVFDSFTPTTTPEEVRDKIREICVIIGFIALAVFIFAFM